VNEPGQLASDQDRVFRALGDATRRYLLDALFVQDGLSLTELESKLEMTRFGVMKHLRQLEEAGLVMTRRCGRKKLHYLNPVPIRLIHDRWVDKYTEPGRQPLAKLSKGWRPAWKRSSRSTYGPPGTTVGGHHRPGDPQQVQLRRPGRLGLEGRLTTFDGCSESKRPSRRGRGPGGRSASATRPYLVALWSDDVKSEGASRVTWEIEPVKDSCHLTVTHDEMRQGANPEIYGGWPMILSGLKSWLETGELLTTPGSLRYT